MRFSTILSFNPRALTTSMPSLFKLGAVAALSLLISACANNPDTAADTTQETTKTSNESPERYRARIHTELGANYFQRGQMAVALEELREAIRLDPSYGMAHSIIGLVYADIGEQNRADAAFQQAIRVAPGEGDIRNNYGSHLCRQNKPREGLEQFDAALRLPLYATPQIALENAGSCALAANLIKPAESYFSRLVQLQPFNSRGFQGLAAIAMKTSNYADVRRQVQMAQKAQPQTPEIYFYGACAERYLRDQVAERLYTSQLEGRFPNSPLLTDLRAGRCE